MKPFNKNEVINAFWKGETTTDEERILKKLCNSDEPENIYFRYIEKEQLAPVNLENMVWKKVKYSRQKQRQFIIRWSIAATLFVIMATMFFINQQKQQANIEEQFVILEHALNYVSNEINDAPTENIIYKGNYIMIVDNN